MNDFITQMESQERVKEIDDGFIDSNGHKLDDPVGNGNCVKGSENLDVDLLEDFDSYMDDINGRLTVSRMVGDAVIKGMVNAFEEEAAEKISAVQLEVARLKESSCFQHAGGDTVMGLSWLPAAGHDNIGSGECLGVTDAFGRHGKMRELLHLLGKDAKLQLMTLKKDISSMRGGCSYQRVGSGSEFVGLSGILEEKESEIWVQLDKTIGSLELTVNSICGRAEDMCQMSKSLLSESKQEEDFKGEVEAMVMQSSIRSVQEEFEAKVWDQHICLCGRQTSNLLEKFNEISGLRRELDALIKSLPGPPDLASHGSIDLDLSHGKTLGSHLSPQTPRWEGNGKVHGDESKTGVPEHFDAAQLNHMSKAELVNYFNSTITKMKREHESEVHELTEKFIRLQGKYLSERRSVFSPTKDKEVDVLRKKVPEVIMKLDDILVESEKLPLFEDNAETLDSLKNRLHRLLAENRQLRDSLAGKKHELKCLTSKELDASRKMLQYPLAETNLQTPVGDQSSSLEDAQIEASVIEEVYRCTLGELKNQIIGITEESELKLLLMQELYGVLLKEATIVAKGSMDSEIDDADLESVITQGLYRSILVEILKDAERKFEELVKKYLMISQSQVSLEKKANEIESNLRFEVEERERLRKQIDLLSKLVEEKDRLAMEMSAVLMKEREQVKQVSEELNNFREDTLSKTKKEVDMMKSNLVEARGQIEVDRMEISRLNKKLECVLEELREAGEQRNMLLALTQEKENYLLSFHANEKEHKKQVEAVISFIEGLAEKITHLESRVTGDMKASNLRLESSSSQLRSLRKKASVLRRTESLYKHRLDDLQKAEAEVDLLGDEVDTLLSLLEKIYVALDHYSPILQHYPGVIEILKLVRKELTGEAIKAV